MKKTIFLMLSLALLALAGCEKGPCDGRITYAKLDPRALNYFFKVGSYWVYRDSADGITDSQYVYYYNFKEHYRDVSWDTTYLNPPHGGSVYCGPYYLDGLRTHVVSFRNGIIADTISFAGGADYIQKGGSSGSIYGHESPISPYYSSAFFFILDWSKMGYLDCCSSWFQTGNVYDTTGTWYYGISDTMRSGPYVFNNVAQWAIEINDGSCPRFAHRTDLYLASGFGIVKMIQHLPTRDVKWDLINYHIAN